LTSDWAVTYYLALLRPMGCERYSIPHSRSSMLKSHRQPIEERQSGKYGLRRVIGAMLVAAGAVAFASEAQAGIIVCASNMVDSAVSGASAGTASNSQGLPIPFACYLRHTNRSAQLLLSGQDGSTSGAGSPSASGHGFSTSAISAPAYVPPRPAMVAWLQFGRWLALPPLLPSGLFRPPRIIG